MALAPLESGLFPHAFRPGLAEDGFRVVATFGVDEHDGVDVVREMIERAAQAAPRDFGAFPSSQSQPPFFSQPG